MKFFGSIGLIACALATVQAHSYMEFPRVRGDPNNPNTSQPDGRCLMTPLNGGPGCSAKPFPCGYPPDNQIVQEFAPGQVFNVRFNNQNNPPPEGDQARHNGGLCEFALSYDGGNTWSKFATYHRTCPDMFYEWPVRIPVNAPAGEVVMSWSWINAVGNREFYQNCADLRITGSNTGTLPPDPFTVANLPGFPELTPEGDPANTGNAKGSGPQQSDIDANTGGGSAPPPPADGGETPPPTDGGETPPPTDGGETPPPTDGGETPPPTDGGETPPPTDGGETPPPTDGGETPPPTDGGDNGGYDDYGHDDKPGDGPGKEAGDGVSAGAPCSQDGQYFCASSGESSEYFVCNHGTFTSLNCADNKVCTTSPDTMIVCG